MSIARKSIQQQAAAEKANIQSWRQQQHRDIDRQAEELRIQQRKTASKEEEQVQRNIAQTDKAVETARKRRTIGIDTDRSALKEAKKEATEKQQKLQAAAKEDKKELTTAEAEARAEIETLAKESEADIEAQKDVALKDVELFEEDNVELNTGEWIDRDAYEALDSKDQELLMRLGISEYNKRKDAEFKQNNIQLKDGNWIDRTFYDELPSEQQAILLNEGIAGFENWQQQQIQASNEKSWNSLQDLITATGIGSSITFEQWQGMTAEQQQNTYDTFLKKYTITVGNNEIVSSSWYESLSPEFQSIVATSGATGLESYIAENYVTTDKEELIDKEYYNNLTTEQKDYIKRYGSQKFENKYYVRLSSTNELVDKNEYNKLPDELKNMLQVKGIDETQKYIDKQQADFNNKYIMLDNGDYVERSSFNAMDPTEQALLKKLGTSRYNAQKDQEFLNELPEDAQKHAKSIGISKFKDILKSTENMNDASAFATLQQIGVIPKEAEAVSRDKDGSFKYKMPVDGYTINLNNIDFDKLSDSDIKNILYTVTNHSDYKATREELLRTVTPFSGSSQSGALSRQQKIALDKWLKELTEKQRKQVKTAVGRYNNSRLVDIISFIFPPAQALKPEITLADIKGTQWAEGFANLALMFVAPAIGAIGKAGSAAAKAASITSKGIQTAAITTYGVTTAVEWDNLSATEKVANIAINAIIALPLGKVASNALIAKLNPKGAAVKALMQSEKTIAKNFSNVLEKSYNSKVAQAFNNLSNIQSKYIKAVYKGSKSEEALALKLKNAADKFIKTLEKNVKKPLAEDREIVNAIKKLPDNIVQNTKEMVKLATQPKASVKQLKKTVAEAEKRLESVKKKFPNDSNKWVDSYSSLVQAKANLAQYETTGLGKMLNDLRGLKNTLKKAKSKSSKIKIQKNIDELELKISSAFENTNILYSAKGSPLGSLKERTAQQLDPIGKSIINELKSTSSSLKQTLEYIRTRYGSNIASDLRKVYSLQNKYITSLGKAERLRLDMISKVNTNNYNKAASAFKKAEKTASKNQINLEKSADNFLNKLKQSGKYYDDVVSQQAFNTFAKDLVRGGKNIFNIAKAEKLSIPKLERALEKAKKELIEIKNKYSNNPELWSDKIADISELERKLTIAKYGGLDDLYRELRLTQNKLKIATDKTEIASLKKQVEELKGNISKVISTAEDLSSRGMRGNTGTRVEAPVGSGTESTTRISGSLATELKRKGKTLPSMGTGSGGSAAATTPAIQTSQVNAVSTQRVERTDGKVQEFVAPKTVTTKVAKTVPHTSTVTDAAFDTVTQQAIEAVEIAALQGATVPEIKTVASTATMTAIETLPSTTLQESIKTQAAQIIKTAIKAAEKAKYTIRIPVKITDKDKEGKTPTPEQLAAAVGWKQGWAYWYIYPPAYGKGGKCRIIRKTPIKGIPLFKDAKSAYLSLTKIGKGELPETIKIPMGITDLIIRTAKGGKPKSQYKRKATSSIPRLRTIK